MISVAAVDLDDTIVRSDGTISDRTLEALWRWEESGRHVVIATGRPPRSTRKIPDKLHHLPWICYNGAVIHHRDQVLYEDMIAGEHAHAIVESILAVAPDCLLGLEIGDVLYVNQPLDRPDVHLVADLLSVAMQPAAKVLLSLDQYNALQPLLADLPKATKVLLSEKYNLAQIMPFTSSKERALIHLVEGWGITMQNVIAFGDDINDVEMISAAGIGVAMDNAVPQVKAIADRITASNDEDGVALILEEMMNGA